MSAGGSRGAALQPLALLVSLAVLGSGVLGSGVLAGAGSLGSGVLGSGVLGSGAAAVAGQHGPGGCAGARPAGAGGAELPVSLLASPGGPLAVVAVCLDGSGPYRFVVDTGASRTVVDTALARRLRLPVAGAPENATGIACAIRVRPVGLSSWSAGGVALAPEDVLATALPAVQGRRLDGLLGSDVLSRFGAVRLDYRARTLALGGAESPPRTGRLAPGSGAPTPARLAAGVRQRAGLEVVAAAGAVVATAGVSFGRRRAAPFVVDTGDAVSAVSSSLVESLRLRPEHRRVELATVGCSVSLPELAAGRWSLGGKALAPSPVAELPAGGIAVAGLLGADQLSRFGAVVLDYRGGRLLLESG